MLAIVLVILICILLFSNVTLYVYNKITPPCVEVNNMDIYKYFKPEIPINDISTIVEQEYIGPKNPTIDSDGIFNIAYENSDRVPITNRSSVNEILNEVFPKSAQEHSRPELKTVIDTNTGQILNIDTVFGDFTADNTHRNNNRSVISHIVEAKRVKFDGYSER